LKKSELLKNRFLIVILAALLLNTLRLANLAQEMRPSKDDYCIAASSNLAIFDNVSFWFTNWAGNITSVLLSNILVGLPLLNSTSWWLASALGFFLTFAVFCTGLTFLYHRFFSSLNLLDSIFVFMFLSGAFVTYFWFSYSETSIALKDPTLLIDLADSLAMWQTVTIGYFLTPMILIFSLISVYSKRDSKPSSKDFVYSFFVGLIVGFMDYVGIATSVGVIFIIEVMKFRKNRSMVDLSKGIVLSASITLAAIVSFFSPGSQVRKEALGISEVKPSLDLLETIVIKSGIDLRSILLQPASALLLGFGVILFLVLSPQCEYMFRPISISLAGVILLHIVVNNVSEVFSYFANWHRLPQFILSVIFWLVLGMELGRMLKTKGVFVNWRSSIILRSFIVIFVVAVQTNAISNFEDSMTTRKEFWLEGKRYQAKDEINTEWIEVCWKDLTKVRDQKGLNVIRN
jgi:hypothetical protein